MLKDVPIQINQGNIISNIHRKLYLFILVLLISINSFAANENVRVNDLLEQANQLYSLNKDIEAFIKLKEALEIDINNPKIYHNIGLIYEELGMHTLAIENFTKAISLDNKFIASYYCRAKIYYQLKKFTEAIKDYETIINLMDNHSANFNLGKVYFDLGNINYELKNYDLAIKYYDECIKNDSNCFDAYYNKSIILLDKQKYEDAITNLNKYIINNKNDYLVYYLRGLMHEKNGNYDLSVNDFTKAINIHSNFLDAYLKRAEVLVKLNRNDQALNDLKILKEHINQFKDKNKIKVYNLIGLVYTKKKQYQLALDEFKEALKINNKDKFAINQINKINDITNKKNKKFSEDILVLNNRSKNLDILIKIGTLIEEGEYALALKYVDNTLITETNAPELYFLKAKILYNYGRYEEVIKYCNKVITLKPNISVAYLLRGKAYTNIGNDEKALYNYFKTLELDRHNVDSYISIGNYYYKNKIMDKALEYYKITLDMRYDNFVLEKIAEINYLNKEYEKALDAYETLCSNNNQSACNRIKKDKIFQNIINNRINNSYRSKKTYHWYGNTPFFQHRVYK